MRNGEGIEGEEHLASPPRMKDAVEEDEAPDLIAPEHGHGHEHKTGIPWLDAVIAASVVFISLLFLMVSIQHGKSMEKMVD